MEPLQKGYYTSDNCETYWLVVPMSYSTDHVNAIVVMYYKNGQYKDTGVDTSRFKLYYSNITHWKEYKRD